MTFTLKEAIQSRKLKLIAKELESLARQDRGVKKVVDQLKKGKEPNPDDITSLKGDTQDDVVMAFASVIGPSKTSDFLDEEKDPCWDGYKQVGTKKKNGKKVPNCVPEGKEDSEIGDRKGSQPASYHKGLEKSTKEKRDAQFKKQAKMDDDNPDAYKPAPGDKSAETKPSKHTKKYDKMFGEHVAELEESNVKKSLQKKSEETGVSYSILKDVYDRGVAAWRTGHRPGTTPTQWGLARVNSFVTGGKTQKTTDKDLWKKHKKNEEVEMFEAVEVDTARYVRSHKSKPKGRGSWLFTTKPMGKPKDDEVFTMPMGDYEQAKKQAQKWAKKKGASTVYVMESVELDEAKMSVGDSVRVKDKPKNVVDKKFFGKAGVISGKAGQDWMVKFPNGRSIVVDAKDLEVMNEAYDAPDYGHEGASDMAMTQLHFIEYAAEEVRDCLEAGAVMEEWYQNKLAKIHGDMEGLHSHMEGQKRRLEMCMGDMEVDSEEDRMSPYMYSEANHSPMHVNKAIRVAKDMGGNMTGAVEKIEKMKKGLSDHPKVKAALRMANEETDLTERVVKKYNVGPKDEVAKVYKAGPRKNVTVRIIKKHSGDYEVFIGGGPWYHDTYKTLKASEQGVEKYLKSLDEGYEKHSNFVTEKAESQAQAIAARIALKHKREGTQPEKGSASAEMMKMSEKDLEDFTKAKKGAPEKVEESVELDEAKRHYSMDKKPTLEKDGNKTITSYNVYYKGKEIGSVTKYGNKWASGSGMGLDGDFTDNHKTKEDAFKELIKQRGKGKSFFKKMRESVELTESHYKVGQKVKCIESGMTGTVVHVDPSDEGKYYTVKREDGKKIKYAPDELKPMGEMKEAKLDPVDKAALKKKFKNRKDKDIDNDGDVDDTDEYLHKRRKAISKAVAKEQSETKLKEKDVDMDGDADDLDKSKRRRQQKVLDTSE